MGLGIVLNILSGFTAELLPYSKRMWTPSFAFLTAGVTLLALAVFHVPIDRLRRFNPVTKALQAFGRNSFLIYFGKYVLASVMIHVSTKGKPLQGWLQDFVEQWSPAPQLTYAVILFSFWLMVAVIMHRKQWYVRV